MKYAGIICWLLFFHSPAHSQLFGKSEVAKFLEEQIEKYAPGVLEQVGAISGLSLDKLKFKKKSIVVKGRANLAQDPSGDRKDPFRFKTKIRVKSGLGVRCLKVHPPGKSFLGIPLYKKVYP